MRVTPHVKLPVHFYHLLPPPVPEHPNEKTQRRRGHRPGEGSGARYGGDLEGPTARRAYGVAAGVARGGGASCEEVLPTRPRRRHRPGESARLRPRGAIVFLLLTSVSHKLSTVPFPRSSAPRVLNFVGYLSPPVRPDVSTDSSWPRFISPCLVAAPKKGADGATTVAGTAYLASLAGIRVFVTGGMGGVHRGAEETFDVSADLAELAQTPIIVVCAGVKSILDIEKTLEVGCGVGTCLSLCV